MRKNMSNFATVLVVFCVCSSAFQWTPSNAANILAVLTIPGKSHWNLMRAVLRPLTDRGHTVTVFTPFADGDRVGYTEVDVSDKIKPKTDMNVSGYIRPTSLMIAYYVNSSRTNCETVFEHPRMRDILGRRSRPFDLLVAEAFLVGCASYAAAVLRVPTIHLVPTPMVTYSERSFFGHVPNPAAVSNLLFPRGVPRTFGERFTNTLHTIYCSWLLWSNELRLRRSDPQPFDAVELVRPSLTFTNTHFITEPSRPLTPDVVQIGGIHLTPPGRIPKDILEFIEDAPHGVIYFTLGSVLKVASLPENVLSVLREAIAHVPQKVLWKYEGEMADKPKNVMTRKWFPQRDILLHPNVKLFICHGGISSVYEAVDAGVPVLGFPIFYDQPRNIDNLVDAGMAISMHLFSVTKNSLSNALLEIVNNNRYQKSAKIASERFKDRPMSPAESVVYWTEYVLRHDGAPHLKSQALNLTWYQYFLIDVIIIFLLVGSVLFFIIYYGLKMTFKHIFKYFHMVKAKRE